MDALNDREPVDVLQDRGEMFAGTGMIEHVAHLREELDRVRGEKKDFKRERDMYHSIREVAAMRMKNVRGKLTTVKKATEEDDVRHRAEKEVHEKKLKHLQSEHQDTVSEVKEARLVTADTLQKEQDELRDELCSNMKAIMVDMHSSEYEHQVKELDLKHQEEMAATRDKLDRGHAEYTDKWEEKLQKRKLLTDSMLIQRKLEWETRIVAVQQKGDTTIRDVKEKAEEKDALVLKQTNEAIDNFTKENRKLKREVNIIKQDVDSALLEKLQLEESLTKVRKETAFWDKMQTCTEKMPPMPKLKVLKDLRVDHAGLEKQFCKVQQERDELLASFEQTVLKKQQEADFLNIMLERRIQAVKDRLEEVEAQLQSAASAPNMDLTGLTNKEEGNNVCPVGSYGHGWTWSHEDRERTT
ncbi:dynein regulatory complex subunit 4-like [Nematolebias whitei]|uniref:dynein regulatory complex subunit 4-like n=1 Tax=Nematolebias whitei TaxID=451745 RepID=UPI001896F55A|nr:dynein regulatory complex subunit 4-like [Nematolebias whitei]